MRRVPPVLMTVGLLAVVIATSPGASGVAQEKAETGRVEITVLDKATGKPVPAAST